MSEYRAGEKPAQLAVFWHPDGGARAKPVLRCLAVSETYAQAIAAVLNTPQARAILTAFEAMEAATLAALEQRGEPSISYEWAVVPQGTRVLGVVIQNEISARREIECYPDRRLYRRPKWTSQGQWEHVDTA